MALKAELEEPGYEVNCNGRGKLPHSQFIANTNYVSNQFFNNLKEKYLR